MSNQQIALPAAFSNPSALAKFDPNWNTDKPEFSDGIRRGFAVVSIKGKVFRITHQGVSRPVLRYGTQEAAGSVSVVFTRSAPGLSKVFYKDGYVEGNQDAPDCFSHDGIRPDRSIQAPQHPNCANCPQNVWGSKITEQGKQTKACADSKRIAIVPGPSDQITPDSDEALDLIANEMFGGAMLLRVPAASLADLAAYEAQMLAVKYPLHAIVTKVSFDINAAFPKLIFTPERPLTEDEFQEVLKLREAPATQDMLGAQAGDAAFKDEPAPHNVVQPAQQPTQAPPPVQQPAPAPVQAPPPVQQPQPAPAAAEAPAATRRTRTRNTAATQPAAQAPAPTLAQQVAAQPAPATTQVLQQPAQAAAVPDLDDALASILGD